MSGYPPYKRQRRTATSVFAGDFDPRPSRDVLTSLLNGVPVNKAVEKDEEARRAKKKEKKEREKEKKRASSTLKSREKVSAVASSSVSASTSTSMNAKRAVPPPRAHTTMSSFWQARPAIHILKAQRSVSVTPPPMVSSPPSTPGPSISSTTSATSSKRPHTPDDDEDITRRGRSQSTMSPQPTAPLPRKKRPAARKGWKGWVEGSPPPSEKLINLDCAPILGERKTRSGKSFDAIGVGKETWV